MSLRRKTLAAMMTASALTVPEPLSDDGDDITTALETAAIFNAQGDVREGAARPAPAPPRTSFPAGAPR